MPRPPRAGITASHVVNTRFTAREFAQIQEAARGLEIEVSTLLRLSALDTARGIPHAAPLLDAAEVRALRLNEIAALHGICCVTDELIKAPRDRARPMEDVTILGYAQYEGYVAMPPSRRDAALIGQAIVRLCRERKIVRDSTRPRVRATNLALQLGLPDAAIGVRLPSHKRAV